MGQKPLGGAGTSSCSGLTPLFLCRFSAVLTKMVSYHPAVHK